ncbi:hypothetical protein WJX72_001828 [[Myrmecia] bisecta]|uniref:Uncharacterized protein n=1 Tax=[Myrmecia] bisecta TaxID=41462 RepID=A0AAW1QA96_9CHLO
MPACTGLSLGPGVAPVNALQQVQIPRGELVEAYEFNVPLNVVALRGSVPAQWLEEYKDVITKFGGMTVHQRGQLEDIYRELSSSDKKGKTTRTADAVTLGDAYLEPAIRAGLLQPIQDAEHYRWWDALFPRWRQLVKRNAAGQLDRHGAVWGAPYRWGCTLVAYNNDKLVKWGGVPITDWSDLLQPRLKGKIAFMDSPREFVGVALKTLGLPFNARARDLAAHGLTVEDVRRRIEQLREQVRLFSNQEHTRAVTAGDAWAVVGWSGDLIPLASRSTAVHLVAPQSGTSLWADLWVVPKGACGGSAGQGPSPTLPLWLEFGLQPMRALSTRGLDRGTSPLLLPGGPTVVDGAKQGRPQADVNITVAPGVLPDAAILEGSEFLLPLDDETKQMYNDLLRDM